MALVKPKDDYLPSDPDFSRVIKWESIKLGDVCAPVSHPHYSDRNVQFIGTFNGATIKMLGSNLEPNYLPLTDPHGIDVAVNDEALKQIMESPIHIKPEILGGDSLTNITIVMFIRRSAK